MKSYRLPKRYDEHEWLQQRHFVTSSMIGVREFELDFSDCEWVDLQPLVDLFLACGAILRNSSSLRLLFSGDGLSPTGRVLRFLRDTGFLEALNSLALESQGSVTYALGSKQIEAAGFVELLTTTELAKRVLDTTTIVPCLLQDASQLTTRDDVFDYCRKLREKYTQKNRLLALRVPTPLAQELKLFFNSMLPELVDNVRLHKPSHHSAQLFALFIRLRRREERTLGVQRIAESSIIRSTKFQTATAHFWQHDTVEISFADAGPSIQQTYASSWQQTDISNKKKIQRLPTGIRLDGKNADFTILKSVLTKNISRLEEHERSIQGLPLHATGLNSIRRSLFGTNCAFAVRSGRNYMIALPSIVRHLDDPAFPVAVKLGGQFDYSPGVQYLFRLAPLWERPLSSWKDGLPKGGLEKAADWWVTPRTELFERVHLVSSFVIPDGLHKGDVVVCRAHHLISKRELVKYLRDLAVAGVNLVFTEMPSAFALRTFNYLSILSAEMHLVVPIVTSSLRVAIVAPNSNEAIRSFVDGEPSNSSYWWEDEGAPIRTVRDLFLVTRQRDSQIFWNSVLASDGAFVNEPVRWSQDAILCGGYLLLDVALRNPDLRKLIRRRLTMLLEQLGIDALVPSSDRLRKLCSEVARELGETFTGQKRYAVVGSIKVSGRTLARAEPRSRSGSTPIHVSLFSYPLHLIAKSKTAAPLSGNDLAMRAFDWTESILPRDDWKWEDVEKSVAITRKGNTEEVTRKPGTPFSVQCKQKSSESFPVWQRHALLELGHFSYGPHHYFLWIDLRRFILERSPDCQEMLLDMLSALNAWSPDWIFYEPHETAELLVDALCEVSADNQIGTIERQRTWPIGQADTLAALRMKTAEIGKETGWRTAVFIDDGMVTGCAIRNAKAKLHDLGFDTVHSLVVLDRDSSVRRILSGFRGTGDHFAWWSLFVGPAGSANSCRICRGVEIVRSIAAQTGAPSLKAVLNYWADVWTERDNLDRFGAAIESKSLQGTIRKKHGDLNVRELVLHTSEAVCAWSIDVATRLGLPGFLLEGPAGTHDVGNASAECLAAVLLHSWDDLSDTYKGVLLDRLIDELWQEPRTAARALLSVAMLSLTHTESRALLTRLTNKIRKHGLPDLVTTVFCYSIVHRVASDHHEAEARLYSWERMINEGRNSEEKVAIRRTNTLVAALAAADHRRRPERFALQILGLPGRGTVHEHLYHLLTFVRTAERSNVEIVEALALIRAYLEPIRASVSQHKSLFEVAHLDEPLEKAFSDFDAIFDHSYGGRIDYVTELMHRLECLLKTSYKGLRNVRQVLSAEYVHYLPYVVRLAIKDIVTKRQWTSETLSAGKKATEALTEGDFEVMSPLTDEERELFGSFPPADGAREDCIARMHRKDVAIVGRAIAWQVIRDCLSDVKHPKKANHSLDNRRGCYMRITFSSANDERKRPCVTVAFETVTTREGYQRSFSNTWSIVSALMQEAGGSVNEVFNQGILRRELTFPAHRVRQGG
ncbi:MAG: hypothetical protein FD157_3305 [Rhodocyclaceae bacterium]|nr:MAG: hypothetical protein FD157_3305 [Rhodocyclaceae bacterium]TND03582.1 MAG: hypothetical protein FD118_1401 [Rhodocyclaceae bacterium]